MPFVAHRARLNPSEPAYSPSGLDSQFH